MDDIVLQLEDTESQDYVPKKKKKNKEINNKKI